MTVPRPSPIRFKVKDRPPPSSITGPYAAMSVGSAVNGLIRTAPLSPCAPTTTPTQTFAPGLDNSDLTKSPPHPLAVLSPRVVVLTLFASGEGRSSQLAASAGAPSAAAAFAAFSRSCALALG